MKLTVVSEIATITYRSGPEWDQRFGRKVRSDPESEADESSNFPRVPALCPDFLIETYLDYQVCIAVLSMFPHALTVPCGRGNNSA